MNLSIIVPVYKDKGGLEILLEEVKNCFSKIDDNIELIVVDDGNEEAINFKNETFNFDLKILKNEENKGYGYSIKRGVRESKNDILAIIDADNSYKVKDLEKLSKIFKEKDMSMLVGKRVFKYRESTPRIIFRKFLKQFSSFIFNYKIKDINSGLRIFKKKDFLEFVNYYPDKFSITSTQTLCYIMTKKTIQYFDIEYEKRVGKSKINIIRDPFNFIYLILKVFLIFSPLKFFGGIGVFFISLSFINILITHLFFDQIADISSIIFFTSGINFIFFGLIGEIIRLKIK